MTKIIDNRSVKMSDTLSNEISLVKDIAIASAYFNVRGFSLIKDSLKEKNLRFLLGKEPQSNVAYRDEILSELENEALDNEEDLKFFSEVKDAVEYFEKDNVQVNIVNDGFFHGKVYMGGNPSLSQINNGFGIIGSSNFTYSGLTSNTELNMLATDRQVVMELSKWFDDMWRNSRDFKNELIEFLNNYVTAHSPLEILAKALEESLKDKFEDIEKIEMIKGLHLHQKMTIQQAWNVLNRYGGVIIADPVGLGKTRVGIALALMAVKSGMKPLIIAPKSILETTWEKEMHDAIGIEIPRINTEMVSSDPDILSRKYKDMNFIIIDEAHYFRSSSSQRYKGISDYLNRKNVKLVLITATPVNNSLMDLYNLISLFVNDDGVPDIAPSLKGFFSQQQKELLNGRKINIDPLLKRFVVRTSRETASKLSKGLSFPSRVIDTDGVSYSLPLDPEWLSNQIDSMNFIYYDLAVDKQVKNLTLPDGMPIEFSQQIIKKETLKALVKTITKINYFKRLESSVFALRRSLERQRDYINKTIDFAQKHKIFIPPKFKNKVYEDGDDFDFSGIPDDQRKNLTMDDKEVEEYKNKALSDVNIINSIIATLDKLESEDVKFDVFNKKISSYNIEGKNGIIIFTSFADTAEYIYNKLRNIPGIRDRLMLTTGNKSVGNNMNDRFDVINYFMNNGGYLVSTDVLSAGQNLQNAQYMVNYDLPWNPVVLIQRTGRIDRMHSSYDKVYIMNMTPENKDKEDPKSLEHFIGIMEKLSTKIEEIRQTLGQDASILGEEPLSKDFNILLDILKGKNEVLNKIDEVGESMGIDLWGLDPMDIYEEIKEQLGEEKIKAIPLGSGAYKYFERGGIFVLFRSGINRPYDYHWVLKFDDGELVTDQTKIIQILMDKPNDNKGDKIDYKQLIDKFKELKNKYLQSLEDKHKKTLRAIPIKLRKIVDAMNKDPEMARYILYVQKEQGNQKIIRALENAYKENKLKEKLPEIIPDPNVDLDEESYEPPQNMRRVVWAILVKKDTDGKDEAGYKLSSQTVFKID